MARFNLIFSLLCVITTISFSPTTTVAWGGVVVNEVKEILGGGDLVVVGDFPWVIGILDISLGEEIRKLVCGGTILSPSHVLTSGRCVTRWQPENHTHEIIPPNSIRLIGGDISRMEDEESEQFRPVLEIILHPDFKYDAGYKGESYKIEQGKQKIKKGFQNDLAILLIDPPFNISQVGVTPIPLGSSSFYDMLMRSDADDLTISGWGITDKRQNTIPTGASLRTVTLPFTSSKIILDKNEKKQKSSSIFGLWLDHDSESESTILQFSTGLGSDRGLMGRCMGDPGSGLIGQGPQGPTLVGIVSFGIWCDRYLPSGQLHLLTLTQLDWIEGIINPKFWAFLSLGVIFMGLLFSSGVVIFVRRQRGGLRSWKL